MKIKFWERTVPGPEFEGVPWVERQDHGVELSLIGPFPDCRRVAVTFTAAEWEDVKTRGDAALGGENPNFVLGAGSSST